MDFEPLDLLVTIAALSLLLSLLCLYIIYRLNIWNGYFLLIFHLSFTQAIYDIGLILNFCPACFLTMIFLRTFAGIATALWSNLIIILISYVFWSLKTFNILENFPYLLMAVYLPSAIIAFLRLCTWNFSEEDINSIDLGINLFRIFSILVNIVLYVFLSTVAKLMLGSYSFGSNPVKELVARMKYYPLIQTFTRIPFSLYLFIYNSYQFETQANNIGQTIFIYIIAISLPFTGIGFFLLFMYLSPAARDLVLDSVSSLHLFLVPSYFKGSIYSSELSGSYPSSFPWITSSNFNVESTIHTIDTKSTDVATRSEGLGSTWESTDMDLDIDMHMDMEGLLVNNDIFCEEVGAEDKRGCRLALLGEINNSDVENKRENENEHVHDLPHESQFLIDSFFAQSPVKSNKKEEEAEADPHSANPSRNASLESSSSISTTLSSASKHSSNYVSVSNKQKLHKQQQLNNKNIQHQQQYPDPSQKEKRSFDDNDDDFNSFKPPTRTRGLSARLVPAANMDKRTEFYEKLI